MTATRPAVRPPQQERSRRSMDRALAVTLELLEERAFDEIPIGEILRRAGHSAGQFYARFAGKEALFEELCRRFEEGIRERVLAEVGSWEDLALADRIERLVRLVALLNVEHRPLLRSLFLRVWADPGRHARLAESMRDRGFESAVIGRLLPGGTAAGARDEEDVRRVMGIVTAACRQELLFGLLAGAEAGDPEVERFVDTLVEVARAGLAAVAGAEEE